MILYDSIWFTHQMQEFAGGTVEPSLPAHFPRHARICASGSKLQGVHHVFLLYLRRDHFHIRDRVDDISLKLKTASFLMDIIRSRWWEKGSPGWETSRVVGTRNVKSLCVSFGWSFTFLHHPSPVCKASPAPQSLCLSADDLESLSVEPHWKPVGIRRVSLKIIEQSLRVGRTTRHLKSLELT